MRIQSGRNPHLFFFTVFFFAAAALVSSPGYAEVSQTEYENFMRGVVDTLYVELANKIEGLDPVPSDFTDDLANLEEYAHEYVHSYQVAIPVENRLRDLPDLHAREREQRLDAANSIIGDVTEVHAKYGELFKTLQSKRDKLIILQAGKLVFDYVLLPLDRWSFIADRVVNYYNDKAGPVKFVPEGGLGSTGATRRLGEISEELDASHTELKKLLYTQPKDTGDYFRIVRAAELQAKKCWDLSYKIQHGLRTDRNNSLAIAENRLKDEIDKVVREVDRILSTTTEISQCRIEPNEVFLDRANPRRKVSLDYIFRSGLVKPAKTGDFYFETDDPETATVDMEGNITGLKTGKTRLIATNRKTNLRCDITVTVEFPPVPGKKVRTPDLLGMTYPQAQAATRSAGLVLTVGTAAKPDYLFPPDTVIRQSPKAFSMVDSGSSVQVDMNPPATPRAELLSVTIQEGDQTPHYVNKPYTLAAVARNLFPKNTYVFVWYVDGAEIGKGQSTPYTFAKAGVHAVKVKMTSTDPSENDELTRQFKIELPTDFTVDFAFAPEQKDKKTAEAGDAVVFTQTCKDLYDVAEYRWYIDGEYFKSGAAVTVRFNAKGAYDVTLAVRRGGNFDEAKRTRTVTVAEKGIGVLGKDRNRFEAEGGNADLSVCSRYWVGGLGKWSECRTVSRVGPVAGYALCTGPQSDGYNTGFLAYSSKGEKDLFFEVYHFSFNQSKGVLHYSGRIPKAENPVPESISISCRANAADVEWTNEDGSTCRTRIWKFKHSEFIRNYGVEEPVCSAPATDPAGLKRCRAFSKTAAEQYRENLSRNCGLAGPEWHDDEERHLEWCLASPRKEADDLARFRENALKNCGKTWCDAYAELAVEQNEENVRNNCGFSGRRWQSDYRNHFDWCVGASKTAADSETRARDKDLAGCAGGRDNFCKTYARTAVGQNEQNAKQGCGLCGRRWQSSVDNHYQWCLTQPQNAADAETRKRKDILEKCAGTSSKGKKIFYEPCVNGYRLDNCLDFGLRCGKPAADRFCKENGFSEAVDWKLEKARPTYVLGDRSICDDDFCAGFEFIACAGKSAKTNHKPVCRIKRPENGATIEPGRYIGFGAEASDPDKDKLTYGWIFEGGRPDTWESWQGSVGGVQWNVPGTYAATLTVTDDKGASCTDTIAINVQKKGEVFDCDRYADKSSEQNDQNLAKNCGFAGELWHSDRLRHVRWCQSAGTEACSRNIRERATALENCKKPPVATDLVCDIAAPSKIVFIDAGESVNFEGSAQGPGNLSYDWKFGEYGVNPLASTKLNPGDVKFQYAGSYTVTFAATDSTGKTCKAARQVLVHDSAEPREFCEGYAGISREQNAENKSRNCGFTGEHWHDNETNHQQWCRSVSVQQAKAALAERDEQLRNCGKQTESPRLRMPPDATKPEETKPEGTEWTDSFGNRQDTRPRVDSSGHGRTGWNEGFDDTPVTRPPSDFPSHGDSEWNDSYDGRPDTRPPSNASGHGGAGWSDGFDNSPD